MNLYARPIYIDGTTETGELSGGAKTGPWALFDADAQDWLVTDIRWRWLAVLISIVRYRTIPA